MQRLHRRGEVVRIQAIVVGPFRRDREALDPHRVGQEAVAHRDAEWTFGEAGTKNVSHLMRQDRLAEPRVDQMRLPEPGLGHLDGARAHQPLFLVVVHVDEDVDRPVRLRADPGPQLKPTHGGVLGQEPRFAPPARCRRDVHHNLWRRRRVRLRPRREAQLDRHRQRAL